MSDEEPRITDSPSARTSHVLKRTGTVSPWDFANLTDEALEHSADPVRLDPADANLNWRPLGPRNLGGRIRCLEQDERNPQTIYAGSAQGGIWRTKNAGESWKALDNFNPPNPRQALAVGAIGLSYSNPEILYVGTGEPVIDERDGSNRDIPGNGLFRSADGGESFTRIDEPDQNVNPLKLGFGQFERIVVDPWEPNRVWIASSDGGIGRGIPPTDGSNTPQLLKEAIVHSTLTPRAAQQATDVMVDFGPSRNSPPTIVTVYVALWSDGIFRAKYNRTTDSYVVSSGITWTLITPPFGNVTRRIKLAQCRTQPDWIGAVSADRGDLTSNVFISSNRGDSWIDTSVHAGADGVQGNYNLLFGIHPTNPAIIAIGTVDLYLGRFNSATNTTAWTKIIDWEQHDRGQRAQHADQHAIIFDVTNPNRIWIGNDGGVSTSSDLGVTWRQRGLGINAAQFFDITTHPTYPYIYAGGLQDNGTWLSYGGSTWYFISGGDGGEVAFDAGNPRSFFMCWAPSRPQDGIARVQIVSSNKAISDTDYLNRLPDVPLSGPIPLVLEPTNTEPFRNRAYAGLFTGVLAQHPTLANNVLIGRRGGVFRTTNGTRFTRMTRLRIARSEEVTKVVYSPQNPNTHWWASTDTGELHFTNNANGSNWADITPSDVPVGRATVTGVAINPNNDAIIAMSVTLQDRSLSSQGRIYISGDSGQNWLEISGRTALMTSDPENQLNPSAATAIAFDPDSSADVANPQTLYVGCMAGVYVVRNIIAPTTPVLLPVTDFEPEWRVFNNNLPHALIFDLEAIKYKDADNNMQKILRCATHARGAYELNLAGFDAVKLLIRKNIIDDGKSYHSDHLVTDDPRLSPGSALVYDRSIDMRIDTPPYRFFGSIIDGLELDEQLRSDELAAGVMNIVYVQIHNTGFGTTELAKVHLYWAVIAPDIPNLQNSFWTQYPNIENGNAWQKIDSLDIDFLSSGQPRVISFNWDVPGNLSDEVALLAIVEDASNDSLDGASLGLVVDPSDAANSIIRKENKIAMYRSNVVVSPADVSARDGFDDTGLFSETAWGSSSHDIIVVQTAPSDPDEAFADINDIRRTDIIDGSATNQIYVRVHNKGGNEMTNAIVEVFQIDMRTVADPNTWTALGSETLPTVAAKGRALFPAISWSTPADPAPNKQYFLLALIQGDGDPAPDYLTRVDSIEDVWKLLLEDVDSGNAVLRAIPWQA